MLSICNIRSAPRTQRGKETLKRPPEVSHKAWRQDIIELCSVFVEKLLKYILKETPTPLDITI